MLTIFPSPLAVKDKAQHAVILDKNTSDKLYKDVQSYRLVTVATLVDRLKVNGSLARQCLKDLEEKGQIKQVVGHSKMKIYSTLTASSFFLGQRIDRPLIIYLQLVPLVAPTKFYILTILQTTREWSCEEGLW